MREWIGDEAGGIWFCAASEARCCRSDEREEHCRRASVYSEFIAPGYGLSLESPGRRQPSSLSPWLSLSCRRLCQPDLDRYG